MARVWCRPVSRLQTDDFSSYPHVEEKGRANSLVSSFKGAHPIHGEHSWYNYLPNSPPAPSHWGLNSNIWILGTHKHLVLNTDLAHNVYFCFFPGYAWMMRHYYTYVPLYCWCSSSPNMNTIWNARSMRIETFVSYVHSYIPQVLPSA